MEKQYKNGQFKPGSDAAKKAGRKGGKNSGGNFKNDPKRAADAGRKGGQRARGGWKKKDENNV